MYYRCLPVKMIWTSAFLFVTTVGGFCFAVGPEFTTVEEYPFIVHIDHLGRFGWSQAGAGVILTNRYILSTAANFYGISFSLDQRRARAGSGTRLDGGVLINFQSYINHPKYYQTENLQDYDIAVAQLAEPLVYGPTIQRGAIFSQGYQLPDDTPVTLVGWGSTLASNGVSDDLQRATLHTVDHDKCVAGYKEISQELADTMTRNMQCLTLKVDQLRGFPCASSGGSPALYSYNGVFVTVGLNCWGGWGCTGETTDIPTLVTTAISPFTDWIVSNVH